MDQDRREELIYRVIGCLIEVHKRLGPGFLENVYHAAFEVELECCGIPFETEKEIRIHYRGREVGVHRLDLYIDSELVVELKTVETLAARHYAQVRSYLKAVDKPIGLLANFSECQLDCRRVERNG